MKKKIVMSSVMLASLLILPSVFAGNVKKSYVNLAKDGAQATATDIPLGYGNIETAMVPYDLAGGRVGTVSGATWVPNPTNSKEQVYEFKSNGSSAMDSQVLFKGLPVNKDNGGKNTVEFWMYARGLEGSECMMPIGFYSSDIWMYKDAMGFNNGDTIYGISSNGMNNNWKHVVAVFANNRVSNSTDYALYIDGVKQTLQAGINGMGSPSSSSVASDNFQVSGWAVSSGYRFNGFVKDVKVYNRVVTDDEAKQHFEGKYDPTDPTLILDAPLVK